MKYERLAIHDVILFEPTVFEDTRGYFFESFSNRIFNEAVGRDVVFVQDNHSKSIHGVVRGLHYQLNPHPQGKLVRVTRGEVFDVAVDIREDSPTFGRWVGAYLSCENKKQLWVPEGFAHGFITLSDEAELLYKTTGYYNKDCDRSILWNDGDLAIDWPLHYIQRNVIVSDKDLNAKKFKEADYF